MKKYIMLFILCSLFLAGCGTQSVIIDYTGKSPSWEVSYKIVADEKLHESFYTFKYTGSDINSVKDVLYWFDGPKEGENGKLIYNNLNENGYTDKMLMRGGLLSEIDRGINVKLEWNGKTEVLILKRVK